MAVFDRLSIRVAAVGAGLCGIALAVSPGVAHAGGAECLQTSAGQDPAAAAPCAPVAEMSGVPMALPGPVPPPMAPPPVVPPVVPPLAPPPVVPPVVPPLAPPPVVPPIPAAGAAGGLPVASMGGLAGKGDLTGPAPSGAPVPGQPIPPGPTGGN
ncbi:hypothetical protein [Mycolicibacterium gilvum]|uniref:Uncharacterized protein n=1 Tax=Mycolicibacterium gilvum TaxID=1804 RepID=A0A378SV79_9MYCO|nr:hypothetical protein [Mycolicibacterium gilvum]MCV7054366.1 hypothetical protein [Mycolicibacterium gilvum]STZ45826.1 Uncharacterised protein [Mycolicibacterium gilvum]